jgi:hypothetical protein
MKSRWRLGSSLEPYRLSLCRFVVFGVPLEMAGIPVFKELSEIENGNVVPEIETPVCVLFFF